jgi:hypothetical protein
MLLSLVIQLVSAIGSQMSLASCPTCGYALSIVENQCRHCRPSSAAAVRWFEKFDARLLVKGCLAVSLGILAFRLVFVYLYQ